ncbi:hypothetical protein QFZ55_001941 [Streptomyces luteogriseus]|uniref:hypothetical protein n=1 Tax=Streptomyces luteogriseus TaxID=68233 RepID=UPI00277FFECD|nr:hypothetical protein [Streptomyces luteogriseus]MDQ0712489.1 hypothetical protein [Streptomyces luteogriseus]
MTQSLAPAARPTAGPGRTRRILRAVAVVSCVPYLALKAAWVAGSHVGIPEGSSLLDDRLTMAVINGLSILLDSAVIALALVLTRPWGLRVPAWLLAFPVWVATGLLAPIMAGFPAQLVVRAFGGGSASSAGREAFLDEWVFAVVYTGFIAQGLALGGLFVLYARGRWGHLWRGRVWDLPVGAVGPAHRALAVAAAVLALLPLTLHALWACGVSAGLSEGRAADRGAEFYVLEALYVVFLLAAVAGAVLLAFRRGRALPVSVPLGLAWVGSGAVACWGGWLSLASLGGPADLADRLTPLMNLAYAGQMLVGLLVAAIGVYHFAERSARTARRAA